VIFTKFLPYGEYLIVYYRLDPLSDGLRGVAMVTNFRVKIGNNRTIYLYS